MNNSIWKISTIKFVFRNGFIIALLFFFTHIISNDQVEAVTCNWNHTYHLWQCKDGGCTPYCSDEAWCDNDGGSFHCRSQPSDPADCWINCEDGSSGSVETCSYEWQGNYVGDGCPAGNSGVWSRYYRSQDADIYPVTQIVLNRVETNVNHPQNSLIDLSPISCRGYAYRYKGFFYAWQSGSYSFRNILPAGNAAFELKDALNGTAITSWNQAISNTCAINTPTRTVTLTGDTWYEYTIEGFQALTDYYNEDCIRLDYMGPGMSSYNAFGVQPAGVTETVFRPCSIPQPTSTLTLTPTPTPEPINLACGSISLAPTTAYRNTALTATAHDYSTGANISQASYYQRCNLSGCEGFNNCGTASCDLTVPSTYEIGDLIRFRTTVIDIPSGLWCTYGGWENATPPPLSVCSNNCDNSLAVSCNPAVWGNWTSCAPTLANPLICDQTRINECADTTETRTCACPTPTPTSGSPTPTNTSPTPTSGSPTPTNTSPTPTSGSPTPTSPTPTSTTVPPTPTSTSVPPTPTSTSIPPTPTPTPTTPALQAVVYGYTYVDVDGDGSNAIVNPGTGAQFSEPALCGVRLIRKNSTNTGLPPNYDNEYAYYCYSKEVETSNTWYKWQTSSSTTQSVYAKQCVFDLATKTLRVRDPNHPNINYRGWYVCNGTLNEDEYSSSDDFVGAGITCDNSSLAGQISGNKPIRIQPKYISYSCPGAYVMNNGSLARDRSFPPSLTSYSAGLTQVVPTPGVNFPGFYQLARSGSGINLQETLLIDRNFSFSSIDPNGLPSQTQISFVTNNTNGPYDFRFLVDASIPTPTYIPATLTPTDIILTNTPTGTLVTPTPTVNQEAWWQQTGGNLYALGQISSQLPSTTPLSYLIKASSANNLNTAGLPITSSNTLTITGSNYTENPGSPNAADPAPHLNNYSAPQALCAQYNFDYFLKLFSAANLTTVGVESGENVINTRDQLVENTTTVGDLQLKVFTGNTTFSATETWGFDATDDKYLFLIDGDQTTFTTPNNLNTLIQIDPGAFVMFVSRGSMTIAPLVGHDRLTSNTSLEGVYLADGTLTIESTDNVATEQRFTGAGSFTGCGGVVLERDLGATSNLSYPAEQFIYRPDLLLSVPNSLKRPNLSWQEI